MIVRRASSTLSGVPAGAGRPHSAERVGGGGGGEAHPAWEIHHFHLVTAGRESHHEHVHPEK